MLVPRFLGDGQIDFAEKPVLIPGAGQLLLQVKTNALCSSECGQFFTATRVTPGHEAEGMVVAAGMDATTLSGTPRRLRHWSRFRIAALAQNGTSDSSL